jgi:hypothetical protein
LYISILSGAESIDILKAFFYLPAFDFWRLKVIDEKRDSLVDFC